MKDTNSKTEAPENGGVAAVVPFENLGEHGVNKETGCFIMPTPGDNIRKRRKEAGLSMRALAEKCNPALDHTTVRRIELGQGFTQDTLERIAVALNCDMTDFFLPDELEGWSELTEAERQQIGTMVQNAALAARYKKAGGTLAV